MRKSLFCLELLSIYFFYMWPVLQQKIIADGFYIFLLGQFICFCATCVCADDARGRQVLEKMEALIWEKVFFVLFGFKGSPVVATGDRAGDSGLPNVDSEAYPMFCLDGCSHVCTERKSKSHFCLHSFLLVREKKKIYPEEMEWITMEQKEKNVCVFLVHTIFFISWKPLLYLFLWSVQEIEKNYAR